MNTTGTLSKIEIQCPFSKTRVFSYSNIVTSRGGLGGPSGSGGRREETRRCHICDVAGHLAKNCPQKNN